MSLKVMSDSTYRDMVSTDQKVTNASLTDQIPNINLTDKPISEITSSNQSGTNNENDKKSSDSLQKQMQSEISKANSQLKFLGTRCEFKYYDDINRVAIKVIDNESNEIVREIPSEEAIELIQKFWEFAGLLYDKKG